MTLTTALQSLISTLPATIALDVVLFFMFLTAKGMRIKEVKWLTHKILFTGFIPFLNIAFILFLALAILTNYSMYKNEKEYAKRKRKTVKAK